MGITVIVILAYVIVGYFKEQQYQANLIKILHKEGVVLWFGNVLTKNDECFSDEIEWYLSFYHENPETDKLIPMFKCLLREPKLITNRDYVEFVTYFFAAAIQGKEAFINSFEAIKEEFRGAEKQLVERIISNAKKFKSPEQITLKDINLLWIEFMATGEETPIKKLIKILDLPETKYNKILINSAMKSIILNAPRFSIVKKILEDVYRDSQEKQKDQIKNTLAALENLEERSKIHIRKIANYTNLKQYNEALDECNLLVAIFPYNSSVYNNMGNIYEYKGDKDRAFRFVKKAVLLDSENYIASFNLGRHYFMRKKYDEAIRYYSKALEYKPMKADYNHALARAYQMKKDDKNAVVYFKKYLANAPHGEFEPLVKKYLASVNVTIEEDSFDLVLMLQRKQYERLNEHLNDLLRNKGKDADGFSLLSNAYNSITDTPGNEHTYDERLKYFEHWVKHDSSSHFSNACLGMFYINYAWKARGKGWASSVVEGGQKLFRKRLNIAREYLEKAYKLDKSDPIVPASLITVARGLGLDHDQMELQFLRGISADNTEFRTYRAKLRYLMPKWHGSKEEMFEFARDIANNSPPDSLAPQILAQAHWEMYYRADDKKNYFRDPNVWKEIEDIYYQLLEYFPDSKEIHNWLARTAYLAGDYETAREEFEYIKDDVLESCWRNMKFFEKAKKEVFGSGEVS